MAAIINLHPILMAASEGDADTLEKLLEETSENFTEKTEGSPPVYPEDYKYTFRDLQLYDEDGRTALHLAASVGNPEMALASVKILLNSVQVLMWEKLDMTGQGQNVKSNEKFELLINAKDKHGSTPLHLAIANQDASVVSYLIRNDLKLFGTQEKVLTSMAHLHSKDACGDEALTSIYKKVPEALKDIFDESIELRHDNKSLAVDWSYLVGRFGDGTRSRGDRRGGVSGRQFDSRTKNGNKPWIVRKGPTKETEYLSNVLNSKEEKSQLLLHPLVKLFLEIKWKKIYWLLVSTILFHFFWLTLYIIAFVNLQLKVAAKTSHSNSHATSQNDEPKIGIANNNSMNSSLDNLSSNNTGTLHVSSLWDILLAVTIFEGIKEVYTMYILRKHYWSIENGMQVLFITVYIIQFCYLMIGDLHTAAAISNMGIILTAILMIFQLGLIPVFGIQVAVFKKVIYSCAPHLPLLFLFFIGFGLSFWSYLYKGNGNGTTLFGMLPRVFAMGAGEIGAGDFLMKIFTEQNLKLEDVIFVFCLIFFIILIVTLYFNLLVGYAVSDIQKLKTMAEELELSNRLSTIYTIESFLLTCIGGLCGQKRLDPFYVFPPSKFKSLPKIADLKFEEIPSDVLKECQEVAFINLKKNKPKYRIPASVRPLNC